jgi:hypothetical protein
MAVPLALNEFASANDATFALGYIASVEAASAADAVAAIIRPAQSFAKFMLDTSVSTEALLPSAAASIAVVEPAAGTDASAIVAATVFGEAASALDVLVASGIWTVGLSEVLDAKDEFRVYEYPESLDGLRTQVIRPSDYEFAAAARRGLTVRKNTYFVPSSPRTHLTVRSDVRAVFDAI